jgi:hypothetical protein
MMKLMTAVALATLITGSAFAQSYEPNRGSGNVIDPIWAHTNNAPVTAAPASRASQSEAVVVNGKVVGQDPDAFIRLQLEREAESGRP